MTKSYHSKVIIIKFKPYIMGPNIRFDTKATPIEATAGELVSVTFRIAKI